MPNTIKYINGPNIQVLKKGGFSIGTGDSNQQIYGFYPGIIPATNGYTIYQNTNCNQLSIYTASNDAQLIDYTNTIFTQSFTSVTQCFNWYNTQSDKMVFNKDYPAIITSGLVLNLDATFRPSYSTSGTTWYDLSPSGNNGTLTNGPTYSSLQGGSIVFDGIDDYVTCDSTSTVNFTDKFTISLWIYINALPTNGNFANLITKYNVGTGGNGGYDFRFSNANGTQRIGLITLSSGAAEGGSDFNYTLSLNTWHYLSGVYNGSTSQVYLNTSLIGSVSNTTNPASNNKLLNIARFGQYGDTTLTRYYNGRIGQVKMYNRALSSAEILQNFYGSNIVTSGLVLYLDAGNIVSYPQTGTVWYDISSGGNNGTLINGPTFDSANGGSIVFDGTNDYVQVNNAASLNGTIQTVSIWFRMLSSTGVGNGAPLISKNGGTSSNNGYTFIVYANGEIQLQIKSATQSIGPFIGDQYAFNVWRNIVFSFSSGVSYAIYDNSVLKSSGSCISFTIATQPLRLIDSLDPFWGIMAGNIAIVQLYNRLLSASEILQNYNAQKSRFGL